MVDILLDKDLKSSGPPSSAKLLMCDFVSSTIDDVGRVEWIASLTMIVRVACV